MIEALNLNENIKDACNEIFNVWGIFNFEKF